MAKKEYWLNDKRLRNMMKKANKPLTPKLFKKRMGFCCEDLLPAAKPRRGRR